MTSSSSSSPLPPAEIIKNRWLGFLIWQSLVPSVAYLLLLLLSSTSPLPASFLAFLLFVLSLLLFSLSLYLVSSPHPDTAAPLPLLASSLLRALLAGGALSPSTADARRRVTKSLAVFGFLILCGASGFLATVAVCGRTEMAGVWGMGPVVGVGLRGLVLGLVFGVDFVWRRRWILRFPIVQQPLFYSFKKGLTLSMKQAFKLSTVAFFCSIALMIIMPEQYKMKSTVAQFIGRLIYFYIGTSAVCICWEFSHHLLQVVHTRRFPFAPPQGSAAAETNPSEVLLDALEQSSPRSMMQYLAYLDLCMVSDSNIEPWRRAAFFEESGETYRRIVSVCLRPLEQLNSRIKEGLEGVSADKSDLLAQQLSPPTDTQIMDSKLYEALDDFQICTWCARAMAALTARSHQEDRYGVAQLTGCNMAVVSTLLSTLIAVEACMGKKTNPQQAKSMGPASIRWATTNTGRRDVMSVVPSKRRGTPLYGKAYAMADVLRTSIYLITSAFETDMQANAKASSLEKNWITDGNPLYGTREILVQKLLLFLEFRAN